MEYTYDDVKEFEGYRQGNYHGNLKLVITKLSGDDTTNFNDWVMCEKNSRDIHKCCCSHQIYDDFYVQHIRSKNVISLGSFCIKRFMKHQHTDLRIEKHRRKNYFVCPLCDKKVSDTTVKQFTNLDIVYHKSCFNKLKKTKLLMKPVLEEMIKEVVQLPNFSDVEILKKYTKYRMGSNTKYPNKKLSTIYKKDKRYIRWLSENCYNEDTKFHANLTIKYFNFHLNK